VNDDRDLLAPLTAAARRLADEDAAPGPAPGAWHALSRARERDRARAAEWPRRWAVPAIAAAALGLALGGVLARRPRPLTYVVSGGRVEANGFVVGEAVAPTELRFSDGTRVRLASGARMLVAAPGPHGVHLRVEEGQAHFEVTHRPGADWSVEVGPYRVQVTGTVFDVRWSAGDEAIVALRVGSVRVTGPHLAAPLTLAAGQRLVTRLATSEVRLERGALDEERASAVAPAAARAGPPVDEARPEHEAPAPAADRPPSRLARPARPAAAPATLAPIGWSERVARGDGAAVLAAARARGVEHVFSSVDASALVALADAARYAGDPRLSARALVELRRRFPGSAEARAAAFQLGRMADDDGDAHAALDWYRRYSGETPRGPFAAEAFGREMLDIERLSGRAAATPLARQYLERFPEGTYLLQARAILGPP
jgi:hypothetical protein